MQKLTVVDLPYQPDSEALFEHVRDLPEAVWLDSGKPRSLQGRFDIISAVPDAMLEVNDGSAELAENGRMSRPSGDAFALAEQMLAPLETASEPFKQLPFAGGLIGYFSYPLGERMQGISQHKTSVTELPEARVGRYQWALVVNHKTRRSQLVFHPSCELSLQRDIRSRLEDAKGNPDNAQGLRLLDKFQANGTTEQYEKAIEAIRGYLLAGDCYQVNFARHFSAPFCGDPWLAYRELRRHLPSPYSAYWQWEDKAILSLSPERFVKLSAGQVEAKPIKGTIRRGASFEEDQKYAIALQNSEKDRAENLMIVDLLRNDLGKSCDPGSIRVPELFALESFANVHHLVSTITGQLRPDASAFDLFRGCFPGGSITGAPKKRAMEIIDELESVCRSVYCGSIGYISATGRMDTNIAIRTLVADRGVLHCWGGGGIVADSSAQSEFREVEDKIGGLMRALEKFIG